MPMVLAAAASAVTWVAGTATAIGMGASYFVAVTTGLSWVQAGAIVGAASALALGAAASALMVPRVGAGGSLVFATPAEVVPSKRGRMVVVAEIALLAMVTAEPISATNSSKA